MKIICNLLLAFFVTIDVSASLDLSNLAHFNLNKRVVFMPPNDLDKKDDIKSLEANLSEADFNRIIDEVTLYYNPVVEKLGGKLTVEKYWKNPKVNAYADRENNNWIVAMFGGLARRPEVTPDGFSLVVCHELGHHLAGFPFYPVTKDEILWAANEGQADYFATLACARNIWKSQDSKNAQSRKTASIEIKNICNSAWKKNKQQNLCYRILEASKSLATLLAHDSEPLPTLSNTSQVIVPLTDPTHPSAQCRLDTMVNAALCPVAFDDNLIPGLKEMSDANSKGAEVIAGKYSCSRSDRWGFGTRPQCWFAPQERLATTAGDLKLLEDAGNGNDRVEPGETFSFAIPVKNDFYSPIGGAIGHLNSKQKDLITFENNWIEYPQILPDKKADADQLIKFKISPQFPCGKRISLDLYTRYTFGVDLSNFQLGTGVLVEDEFLKSDSTIEIPPSVDSEGNYNPTIAELESHSRKGIYEVKIEVVVQGMTADQAAVYLVAPDESYYPLNIEGDHGDLNQIYTVQVDIAPDESKTKKLWQLWIYNISEKPGLLDWNSKLFTGKCE